MLTKQSKTTNSMQKPKSWSLCHSVINYLNWNIHSLMFVSSVRISLEKSFTSTFFKHYKFSNHILHKQNHSSESFLKGTSFSRISSSASSNTVIGPSPLPIRILAPNLALGPFLQWIKIYLSELFFINSSISSTLSFSSVMGTHNASLNIPISYN